MDKQALVYADLQGTPHLVGRLWARMRKDRESATFEYDKTWLTNPDHFSLEPALKLGPGPFHTPSHKPLFGAIGDSAPDRWGRVLMRRAGVNPLHASVSPGSALLRSLAGPPAARIAPAGPASVAPLMASPGTGRGAVAASGGFRGRRKR